jgi:hypothetical protein
MSAHIPASCATAAAAVTRLFQIRFGVLAILPAVALLIAGCADAPRPPLAGPDPADPGARVPRVDYRSTVGSYRSRRPAEPAPGGEQNERVTPAPKSGQ